MRHTDIRLTHTTAADPAAVYALLRDGASWRVVTDRFV